MASNVAEALNAVRSQSFDVIVSDIGLPDGTGYDIMSEAKRTGQMIGVALTGYGMPKMCAAARKQASISISPNQSMSPSCARCCVNLARNEVGIGGEITDDCLTNRTRGGPEKHCHHSLGTSEDSVLTSRVSRDTRRSLAPR